MFSCPNYMTVTDWSAGRNVHRKRAGDVKHPETDAVSPDHSQSRGNMETV